MYTLTFYRENNLPVTHLILTLGTIKASTENS